MTKTLEDVLAETNASIIFKNMPERVRVRIATGLSTCWIWCGKKTGEDIPSILLRKGKAVTVSKFILYLLSFPITPGIITHTCNNKLCVNPWHFWSSRHSKFCRNGHLRIKNHFKVSFRGTITCKLCRGLIKSRRSRI